MKMEGMAVANKMATPSVVVQLWSLQIRLLMLNWSEIRTLLVVMIFEGYFGVDLRKTHHFMLMKTDQLLGMTMERSGSKWVQRNLLKLFMRNQRWMHGISTKYSHSMHVTICDRYKKQVWKTAYSSLCFNYFDGWNKLSNGKPWGAWKTSPI